MGEASTSLMSLVVRPLEVLRLDRFREVVSFRCCLFRLSQIEASISYRVYTYRMICVLAVELVYLQVSDSDNC